eukprot:gene9740-11375_t
MNSFGRLSRTVPFYNSLTSNSNTNQKFITTSVKLKNEFLINKSKLASAALIHRSCFSTSRVEERLIEEVGTGQADPSFNPSPS